MTLSMQTGLVTFTSQYSAFASAEVLFPSHFSDTDIRIVCSPQCVPYQTQSLYCVSYDPTTLTETGVTFNAICNNSPLFTLGATYHAVGNIASYTIAPNISLNTSATVSSSFTLTLYNQIDPEINYYVFNTVPFGSSTQSAIPNGTYLVSPEPTSVTGSDGNTYVFELPPIVLPVYGEATPIDIRYELANAMISAELNEPGYIVTTDLIVTLVENSTGAMTVINGVFFNSPKIPLIAFTPGAYTVSVQPASVTATDDVSVFTAPAPYLINLTATSVTNVPITYVLQS